MEGDNQKPTVHPQIQKQAEIARMRTDQEFLKLKDQEKRRLDLVTPLPRPDGTAAFNQAITTLAKSLLKKQNTSKERNFITRKLTKVVPTVGGELILVAAHSGKGKSTVVANICYSYWKQQLPILVFSNEESGGDVILRVAGIETGIGLGRIKDGDIANDEGLRLQQIMQEVRQFVTVVDKDLWTNPDFLKSVDGFKHAWSTFGDFNPYEAVVIDYYQNVTRDTSVPSKSVNEVQSDFADFLDTQKNNMRCPIFVMAQLKEATDENETEFENRLKGRKIIFDKCTFALELTANKKNFTSKWQIRKDRSRGRDGMHFITGFDYIRSQYVEADAAFIEKQMSWIRQRAERSVRINSSTEDKDE